MLTKVLATLLYAFSITQSDLECTTTTIDSEANGYTSLALDTDDNPIIAYQSRASLKLKGCVDPICSASTQRFIDITYDIGEWGDASLAMDRNDYPVISSFDSTNQSLILIRCHDEVCKNMGLTTIRKTSGCCIYLLLDNKDYPVISYYNFINQTLELARCHDQTCINATFTTIDNSISIYDTVPTHYISLVLDAYSIPVVSYFSQIDNTIKIAYCYDETCSNVTLTIIGKGWEDSYLTLSDTGKPVISYIDYESGFPLKLARCHDKACSNITLNTVPVLDIPCALSYNAGNPLIVYYDDGNLVFARCEDEACSNMTSNAIAYGYLEACVATLVLDSNDYPVITYLSRYGDLKLVRCHDRSCKNITLTTIDKKLGDNGYYISLDLDSNDYPVIVYRDISPLGLKLAKCGDHTCSPTAGNTLKVLTRKNDVGEYTSLALDNNEYAVVSYYDSTNENLKLARCYDRSCMNASLATIDNTGSVGRYTSIALDQNGMAVVSYYDHTNQSLKLCRCHDANCLSRTLSTVDSGGSVGQHSSLFLDKDYFPVISYWDYTNQTFKLARCHALTCSSATFITLDSIKDDGASIALDSNGLVVITYWDYTSRTFKLARCHDKSCNSITSTAFDSVGEVELDSSPILNNLLLNRYGYAVISYTYSTQLPFSNDGNVTFKIARCHDLNCSNVSLHTIIEESYVLDFNIYASTALDSNGYPVISYYDGINCFCRPGPFLKLIRCVATHAPSYSPSYLPTIHPTLSPSQTPTTNTNKPTGAPSKHPTKIPTPRTLSPTSKSVEEVPITWQLLTIVTVSGMTLLVCGICIGKKIGKQRNHDQQPPILEESSNARKHSHSHRRVQMFQPFAKSRVKNILTDEALLADTGIKKPVGEPPITQQEDESMDSSMQVGKDKKINQTLFL